MKKPRRELLPGCIFGYYLATTTTENCCTSLNDTKSKMTIYRLIQDAAKRDKMDKPQLITRRSLVQIRPPQPPSILILSRCFFFFAYKTRGRTAVRPLVCVYIFYSIPCRRCSASSSWFRAALRWSSRRSLLYWKYRSQPFSAMKAWAAGERVSSVTKTTIS